MSVLLEIDNFAPVNKREHTYLDAEAAAGSNTITVKSVQNVAAQLFVLVGRPAQENTELRSISGISGNVLTLGGSLEFDHKRYTSVLVLQADQLQVYAATGSTQPDDSDFSVLAGGLVSIDYDELVTSLTDPNGGADTWYKYTYKNSITGAETALGNSEVVRGGAVHDYCDIRDIRYEAGLQNNPYLTDVYIASQRLQAQSVIDGALKGTYGVPLEAPVDGIISRMTVLLAAGYILKREFGDGAVGTSADGQQKINEVMRKDEDNPGLLWQVVSGKIVLTDGSGQALAKTTHVSGWPNATTATTPVHQGGSRRKFRAGMEF